MIPGEVLPAEGEIELNAGRKTATVKVHNTGDRPIQVGSHYHFFETNPSLVFDRGAAYGSRLNIAAGTAIRFEPGQGRTVELVALAGKRRVFGFRQAVMGALKSAPRVGGQAPAKVPGKPAADTAPRPGAGAAAKPGVKPSVKSGVRAGARQGVNAGAKTGAKAGAKAGAGTLRKRAG